MLAVGCMAAHLVMAQMQPPKSVKTACGGKTVANTFTTLYENKPLALNAIGTVSGEFTTGPAKVDSIGVTIRNGSILYKCGPCTGADTVTGVKCTTTSSAAIDVKVQGGMIVFKNNGTPSVAYATSPSQAAPFTFMLKPATATQKNLSNTVKNLVLNLQYPNLPVKNTRGCREYVQVIYALTIYYANGCITQNIYEYHALRL